MAITASVIPSFTRRIGGGISAASSFVRPKISSMGSMIDRLRPNTDQRGQGEGKGRFFSNFMGFGSARNEKRIKKSMKLLRNTLVETFEIAKILRVGVQKTAEQLKGLASGKGGGGGGFLGGLFGGLLGGLLFGGGPILLAIKAIIAGAIVNWLGEKFFPETTEKIKNWVGSKVKVQVKRFVDAYLPTAIITLIAGGLLAKAFPGTAKSLIGGGLKTATKTAVTGGAVAGGLAVGTQMGGGNDKGMGAQDTGGVEIKVKGNSDLQSVGIATKLLGKFDSILNRFSKAIKSFSLGKNRVLYDGKEDSVNSITSNITNNNNVSNVNSQTNNSINNVSDVSSQTNNSINNSNVTNNNNVSNDNSQINNLINNDITNNNISKHIDNIKNGTNGINVTFVPYNVNANNNQPSAVSPIINPSPSPNNSQDFAFYTSHNPDSYSDFETKLMYNIVEA